MNKFALIQWLGIDSELVAHWDQAHFQLDRPAVAFVAAIFGIPATWLALQWHRRRLATTSRRLSIFLTAARLVVFGLLMLVLAGPRLKLDLRLEQKPVLGLVVDASASMDLAFDKSGGPSRRGAAANAIERGHGGWLSQLAERFELIPIAFGRDAHRLEEIAEAFAMPSPVDDSATDMATALDQLLASAAGKPLGGVVLFSDGQNSAGTWPVDSARRLREGDGGLFVVPTGPQQRLVDVAIVDAVSAGTVFVGDSARVSIAVESHGLAGAVVPVELRDGDQVLDRREIALRDGEQQRIDLGAEFSTAGDRYLTATIPRQPSEASELQANNSEVIPVCVTADKRRVLYLEGGPRWDFRFLKNAMRRDRGLRGLQSETPDIRLESESNGHDGGGALTDSIEKLSGYHTIIIGEVSSKWLSAATAVKLTQLVEKFGVGLIVAAGPHSLEAKDSSTFRALWPLRFDQRRANLVETPLGGMCLALTPEGQTHAAMQLSETAEAVASAWSSFPPFHWAALGGQPKPGTAVLANAVAANKVDSVPWPPQPVLAWHRVGKGKVLFLGVDSTWQWRQNVGDRYFYRFWGQAIAFVAREDPEIANRSRIELRPRRPRVGEMVDLDLYAFHADRSPCVASNLSLTVHSDGAAASIALKAASAQPGRYVGRWRVDGAGEREFRIALAGSTITKSIRISACPPEHRKPQLRRDLLGEMAAAGGGTVIELDRLTELPSLVRGEPRPYRLRKDFSLWDNGLVLAFFVAAYALDIAIRRLNGLS